MKYIKPLSIIFITLQMMSCELLLGPIGPLSQIQKSQQSPWNMHHELFSTSNNGWADNGRAQIVERGGQVYAAFGVQYNASFYQDIEVYGALTVAIPQVYQVSRTNGSFFLENIFDISVDTQPRVIYKKDFSDTVYVFDVVNQVPTTIWNTNLNGYNAFLPQSANMLLGEFMGSLIFYENGATHTTNFLTSLPMLGTMLHAMRSEYKNSKQYLSYLCYDGMSNYINLYEATGMGLRVQNVPIMESSGALYQSYQFDITVDEYNNIFAAFDDMVFISDGSMGLTPLNSNINDLNTTNGVALYVKNGNIHMANYNGTSLDYIVMNANNGSIILDENITNFQSNGFIKGMDIYVDSANIVYIGILEYNTAMDRTYGHVLYR